MNPRATPERQTQAGASQAGHDSAPSGAASPQNGAESLVLELPLELSNGNTGRGHKFFNTAKRRKEIEVLLRTIPHHAVRTPARIHLTRVLGKRQSLYDADSLLRGTAKELIDAIAAVGIIPDDGPKHITEVTASQDATRRKDGPATVVTITTLEEGSHV